MIMVEQGKAEKVKGEDALFVSFPYSADNVAAIKTLPVRYYHASTKTWEVPLDAIQPLVEMFGEENMEIDDIIDRDYVIPAKSIEEGVEKWAQFIPILDVLSSYDKDIANFTMEALNRVPDYFYEVAASSTGKYHPAYALGEGGLARHTISAAVICIELLRNETMCGKFTPKQKAICLSAITLHDTIKHGHEGSNYTDERHPLLAADFIRNMVGIYINNDTIEMIADCIESHMGQWNTSYKTKKEILPLPTSSMQKFVHLCDYLSSRKCLEFNFDSLGML